MIKTLVFLILGCAIGGSWAQAAPFVGLDRLQKALGFTDFYSAYKPTRTIRVAILDQDFAGWEKELGKSLPSQLVHIAGPVPPPAQFKNEHGLRMAQALTAFMTDEMKHPEWAPELYLYTVYGFTNFKSAIEDAVARKIDVILYSEVWEYGNNFDGKGFINAEVSKATQAGIVWVNAAGNFNLTTHTSPIKAANTGDDDWVPLPDANRALALRCEKNDQKQCQVKIVLSWNDFKDDISPGTDKDLDLALTDDLLNIVATSTLRQSKDPNEARPGFSKYPREIIEATLSPGLYFIRVKNRSQNFGSGNGSGSSDVLRITAAGEFLTMPSHTTENTLLNPADHSEVITVGASDSDRSGQSKKMAKPELLSPSSLKLEGVGEFRGSSNSAAIVAAGFALLKSEKPSLTRTELIAMTTQPLSVGLPERALGFTHTGPGCFTPIPRSSAPPFAGSVLNQGGVFVVTSQGARILTPFDPISLAPGLRRIQPNDLIAITPRGFELYPRYYLGTPRDAIEVFQRPLEAGVCGTPNLPRSGQFGLRHPTR